MSDTKDGPAWVEGQTTMQGQGVGTPMTGVAELAEFLARNTGGATFARIPVPLPGVPGDGVPVAVVRKGVDSFALEPIAHLTAAWQDRPLRRSGVVKLTDLDSFIAFVNEQSTPSTRLFATPEAAEPSLLAILDYHDPRNVAPTVDATRSFEFTESEDALPRWGEHRASYHFPLSREWKAWKGIESRGSVGQIDFAEFIEDRVADIVEVSELPGVDGTKIGRLRDLLGGTFASPSRMIELARGLTVHEASRVKSQINLASGEHQIAFESTHVDADGQLLKVPNLCMLVIPIFENGQPYQLAVRIRYRKTEGGLKWSLSLYMSDEAKRDAVLEAAKRAETMTGRRVFFGEPETRQSPVGVRAL